MTRKAYPTDISDVEWDLIKSMIPAESKRKRGKKRQVDMREVVNAIFYILRAGCSWSSGCLMIYPRGKQCLLISVAGNVKECGKKFTPYCDSPKGDASRITVTSNGRKTQPNHRLEL